MQDTQKRPRSFLSRMVYKVRLLLLSRVQHSTCDLQVHVNEARVWFTGAPKHAYQALDETIQ